MRLASIDPGSISLGLAFFDEGGLHSVETIKAPSKLRKEADRVDYLLRQVENKFAEYMPRVIAIERLDTWTRKDEEGHAKNVGSLISLAFITGALYCLAIPFTNHIVLVPVKKWLNKRSPKRREFDAEQLYGHHPDDEHQADAILIGHYVLSELNIEEAQSRARKTIYV